MIITSPDPAIMQNGLESILRLCHAGRHSGTTTAPVVLKGIEAIASFCLMSLDELAKHNSKEIMQ